MNIFVLIAAIAGGGLLLAKNSGALAQLTGGPKLYALTSADVEQIASAYHSGHSNYVVRDANGSRYTLGDAMHRAIQNLQVECYIADGYCQGAARPSGNSILEAGQGASVGLSAAESIGSSIEGTAGFAASSLGQAIPIVGTFVGLFTGVMNFVSAHHAAAVRLENSILCPLIPALNQAFANAKANMASGKWNGAQVTTYVNQTVQEAQQVIAQDSGSGALRAVGEEVDAIRDAFDLIISRSGI